MIFLFDLDGTLIYDSSDKIPKKNIESLRKIKNSGYEPIIATGRMLSATVKTIENLNICKYLISYNGAMIAKLENNNWKIIDHSPIENDAMKIIKKIIKKYMNKNLTFFLYDIDNLKYYGHNTHIKEYETRSGIKGTSIKNIDDITFSSTKFLVSTDNNTPELLNEIEKEFKIYKDFFNTSRSMKHYLEITKFNVTKGSAVKFIKEKFQDNKIIAFGDSYNDESMFIESDISLCMNTSPESIKNICSYVLPSKKEDSISYGVEKFCK
jgi:Cof subfamily protein (haloacid dehalogenase superfamily)